MGIQGGNNIKAKINEALKTLRTTYKGHMSCDTEVNHEHKVIKATLYSSGSTQKHILSTGYSHFNNRHEISDCAERAIIDTIKNYDTTLIK